MIKLNYIISFLKKDFIGPLNEVAIFTTVINANNK